MIEVQQDLWTVDADVRCITTNGTVTGHGTNIMGGGCAAEAARLHPQLPARYGDFILKHGNHVFLVYPGLVMFPTKETISDPATLACVARSVGELEALTDLYGWARVALPRPGCGLGGLSWDDVYPIVAALDDRFILVDFPRIASSTVV